MANPKAITGERIEGLEAKVDSLAGSLEKVLELFAKSQEAPKTDKEKVVAAEAKTAEANNAYLEPVPPDWVADLKAKLEAIKMGEALDHCEIDYPKNGLPRYTIVIKNEFSNASSSHLQYYKVDRRTIPVEKGFESVKQFNSLVAQNLRMNPKKVD